MKYTLKIIGFLFILFHGTIDAQHIDSPIHAEEQATQLIAQLAQKVSPAPGTISFVFNRLNNENKPQEAVAFIQQLLRSDYQHLNADHLLEILQSGRTIQTTLDEADQQQLQQLFFARKKYVYDQFVEIQQENMSAANTYLLSGQLDQARALYSEVLALPYYKLNIDEGTKTIRYAQFLYPLQQGAYLGLLEITEKAKDRTLLSVLKGPPYLLLYQQPQILEVLNAKLEAFGMEKISSSK